MIVQLTNLTGFSANFRVIGKVKTRGFAKSCGTTSARLVKETLKNMDRKPHGSINSLGPSDAIWRQKSGTTLPQVMACCLTAPSHYLNQCWLIIRKVQWCSSEDNFISNTTEIILKMIYKIFHSNLPVNNWHYSHTKTKSNKTQQSTSSVYNWCDLLCNACTTNCKQTPYIIQHSRLTYCSQSDDIGIFQFL